MKAFLIILTSLGCLYSCRSDRTEEKEKSTEDGGSPSRPVEVSILRDGGTIQIRVLRDSGDNYYYYSASENPNMNHQWFDDRDWRDGNIAPLSADERSALFSELKIGIKRYYGDLENLRKESAEFDEIDEEEKMRILLDAEKSQRIDMGNLLDLIDR